MVAGTPSSEPTTYVVDLCSADSILVHALGYHLPWFLPKPSYQLLAMLFYRLCLFYNGGTMVGHQILYGVGIGSALSTVRCTPVVSVRAVSRDI